MNYRILTPDEIIEKDDQFWTGPRSPVDGNPGEGYWKPCESCVGCRVYLFQTAPGQVRRPINL